MAVYLDSVITEYWNGSAWANITAYVVGDIKGTGGLGGWKPDARVGTLGTLDITLNNKSKIFSPMGGDAIRGLSTLAGFNRGAKIRVRGVIASLSKVIWTGRILSIDSDDKNWGNEQVRLMAGDWMNIPAKYPMKGTSAAANLRIDEAMTLLLSRLSIQPEATRFDTGVNTFPAVFDNVQRNTKAISEFNKLASSELSYIYVTHDGTLVAEGMNTRQGWRALDQVWITPDVDSLFLLEDGTYLLLEDGTKLILDEWTLTDAAIATDLEEHDILLSESSLLNSVTVRSFPITTDTSLKVLYNMGSWLSIPSAQTMNFSAHYTDPNGKGQISGSNMQTPVATTDYTAIDSSGADITASVTVSATYYSDTVYYSITNPTTGTARITFLQARGYGIYYGNSAEITVEDTDSQELYGYAPFSFDMKYQKDTYLGEQFGKRLIGEYGYPKSRITKMKFLANLNKNHMMTFLTLTIGALILGTEDRSGISNHYYITDRSFTIKQGGIINVEYGVKQNDTYLSGGVNPITVEFDDALTQNINYGAVRETANLPLISYSFWVNFPNQGVDRTVFSRISGYVGDKIMLGSGGLNDRVLYWNNSVDGFGEWISNAAFSGADVNKWTHFVITYDGANTSNLPLLYVKGSAITMTVQSSMGGRTKDEMYTNILIGGNNTSIANPGATFKGKIFDFRIYNRILTAAEAVTIYNSGTPNTALVTDGLVFQANAIYADQGTAASLAGHVLTSTDRLVEHITRTAGTPYGSPIIRANP